MNNAQALQALYDGKKVKKSFWDKGCYIHILYDKLSNRKLLLNEVGLLQEFIIDNQNLDVCNWEEYINDWDYNVGDIVQLTNYPKIYKIIFIDEEVFLARDLGDLNRRFLTVSRRNFDLSDIQTIGNQF